MIEVNVRDSVTPYIESFLRENPRFIRSLTKSVGWFVQREIKKLSRNSRITSRWRKRTPLKRVRRKLDAEAPDPWLGKLRNAIGYQYADGAVLIGWTSPTAAMEGRIQEEGARRTVTPQLRGYFARKGVPLSESKKHIKVPERPLYEPAMEIVEPQIGTFMADKVKKYIEKDGFVKKAATRKYEVFG